MRLWEKEEGEKISEKSDKNCIRLKIGFCEVCSYYTFYDVLDFIMNTLTLICFSGFVASLTPRERSSGSIGHK